MRKLRPVQILAKVTQPGREVLAGKSRSLVILLIVSGTLGHEYVFWSPVGIPCVCPLSVPLATVSCAICYLETGSHIPEAGIELAVWLWWFAYLASCHN